MQGKFSFEQGLKIHLSVKDFLVSGYKLYFICLQIFFKFGKDDKNVYIL